jgi:hypothetical protein
MARFSPRFSFSMEGLMKGITFSTFGRNVPPEYLDAADRIAEADFLSYSSDDLVIREFKRYLLLRLMFNRPITLQSPAVDQVWHAFILDTRNYRRFCDEVFGAYLDHTSAHFEPDPDFPIAYHRLFGEELPPLWDPGSRPNSSRSGFGDLGDLNCA